MKKFSSLNLLLLFFPIILSAQVTQEVQPSKLTHWLSPEEALRKNEIGKNFVETDPPSAPMRNVAEFDPVQGCLIAYPFGIPMDLIKEMATDVMLTTIVLNSTQENTVLQQYQAAGVNLNHCNFLLAPTNSYWTRDYGPWFESDSLNHMGIVDFPYNRPRPDDDEIPKELASMLGIPWYGMNLIATGGNYMTDGMGISTSTTLTWDENPTLTHDQIAQKLHDYLGINTYLPVPDPTLPETYIEHIDCWGKYLAPDKILIRKVPPTHPHYAQIEATASFYASQICSYGYPYRVFRVNTPQDQPYTNSLILNNKVMVPIMNSTYDDSAIMAYQAAMPGYEIHGYISLPAHVWESTDALHCRVMGIADLGQLYIHHIPISGNQPAENDYLLTADLIPCSDSAIYNDSVLIYYKVNNGPFILKHMVNTTGHHYTGIIPKQAGGSTVKYYIYAADKSVRHAMAPFMGPADPFIFQTIYTNITAIPDTLWFTTPDDCNDGKITTLHNFTGSGININYIQSVGTHLEWYVDSMPVSSFPYMLNPADSLKLKVKMHIVTKDNRLVYLKDSMNIITDVDTIRVIIMENPQLTGIRNNGSNSNFQLSLGNAFPDPVSDHTSIPFKTLQRGYVNMDIMNVQGQIVRTLLNGTIETGSHTVAWDGTDNGGNKVSDGIYIIRLTGQNSCLTKRIIVMK
jgi:agmatine deiminase